MESEYNLFPTQSLLHMQLPSHLSSQSAMLDNYLFRQKVCFIIVVTVLFFGLLLFMYNL